MQAAGVSSPQDAQLSEQKKFTKISRDNLSGNDLQQQISTASSSSSSSQLLSISFHLKQCTVYNNKFGCYSIDLRYGGISRRSPTINILKEKINLNVVINLMEVQFEDKDVQISLFNQTLAKSKQTDILLSQQTLPLSQFKETSVDSKKDQIMTFSQGGQVKAEIRFVLAVRGMSELDDLKGVKEEKKRNFMELLKEWMRDRFLVRIIAKYRQNEIRLAEEERLRILKEQEDELARKKLEEQAALKKKRMEEEEKAKAEMKKKQEEILRKRQEKQRELEEKELKRKQEEDLKREEEERQKKDEQERKRKKKEQQELKKAIELKEKEERDALERQKEQEELKMYEGENFEVEVEEIAKKKVKPQSKKKIQDEQEDEEIEEDLNQEQEGNDDQKKNSRKGKVSSAVVFKSMARKRNSNITTSLPEFNGIVMIAQGVRSPDNRSTSLKQFSRKSTSVNNPRNFMSLLKQWMGSSFLKKIIKNTNLEDRLIIGYQSYFFIFGDETFPFIVKFCPKTQEIQKLPLPKSLQIYRYSQAVSLPNGKIFTCGGVNSRLNNILPFVQIYDPYINAGFPLPSMNQARYTHSAAYFRGCVYVIGGRSYGSGESSILCSFERFNLSSNSWENLQSLSDGRCTTSLIGLPNCKNYLFLIGGFSPRGRLNTIERYSIQEDSWKTLNVTLPSEVEAGISIVSASKSSFYFLYGRGNKDRNEDIFELSVSGEESSEKYEITQIGKVTKTKVLPAFFIDDNSQKLFIFGGDDQIFSSFDLPSFQYGQSDQSLKASSIFPADTKMFSYSLCALEQPKRPFGANTKETFYSHFVLIDTDGSVKQIKTGKEQTSSVSQLDIPSKSVQNYSCSLLDNNYLVVFGGDYLTQKNQPQNNPIATRLSKECFISSLNTGKLIRRNPSLTAKRNSAVFMKNQMIYSFGGEKSTNQGNCEITTSSERFLVRFNKWERISPLPAAVAQSKIFEFGPQIYFLGGISAGRTFNSSVFEYNLQLDYFVNNSKQVPIEFKNSFQFYTKTTKQVTPFVLIFNMNFKAQGLFNLIDGSFIKTDILPGYSDEDKRSLTIAQEAEFISFIFSNRIEIFRAFIPDSTLFTQISIQGIEFIKLKEVPLSPSISKNLNIKQAFITRFVTQQMEIYDFLDQNILTNTGISAKTLNQPSKDKKENPQIVTLFLDNQGEPNFIRQDISTGQEDFLDFRTKEKTDNQPIKFHKKSILCYEQETNKIFISGGVEDTKSNAVPYIIEVDLNSKKTSIIGEMLTPRHSHCSVIVGDYLYMIGGCANTNGNYKKNSATSQSFQRLQQIAATKNANAQAVIEIQSQLASKKRSNLENARNKNSIGGGSKDDKSKNENGASQNLQNLLQGEKKYFIPSKNYLGEDDDFEDDQGTFNGGQNNNNNSSGYINESFLMRMSAGQINISRSSISIGDNNKKINPVLVVLKKVDRLNLRTCEMESVADLGLGVMNASCCVMRGGIIYVIGGKDSANTTTDCIQKYETFSNSWEIINLKLSEPLHSISTYAVGFSQILVFGGIKGTNTVSNDIYVIDSKSGNISKSNGTLQNKHVSGIILAGRRKLFALDKDSIQMAEPVNNFDTLSVSQITPISAMDNSENINLIGAFLMNIHDENSNSASKKNLDNFLLIGNETNKRMIHLDIRNQRLKQIEVPKNLQLISQSSACFAEDTQSVVISGGIDLQNGGIVSSQIQLFKLNSQSIILKQQLIIPRFLHASICIGSLLITIGGKTNQHNINQPEGLQSPDALLHSQKSLMSYSTSERSPISRGSITSSSSFSCTAECEIFDLKTLKGQSISRLNIPRSNIQVAILLDHIFVFGGFGGDKRLRSIEKYSQKKDSWQIIDCYLPFDLESYQLCYLSPVEALIAGGKENGQISTKMFIFNAKFNIITLLSFTLPAELPAFKCTVFGDELFIFGANKTTPLSVCMNLRNGFEDHSKIQPIPQLSIVDANWTAVLFK